MEKEFTVRQSHRLGSEGELKCHMLLNQLSY